MISLIGVCMYPVAAASTSPFAVQITPYVARIPGFWARRAIIKACKAVFHQFTEERERKAMTEAEQRSNQMVQLLKERYGK